jgi:glutathione synthase
LRDQGLTFVGIDVIGDHLIQIKDTSSPALLQVARFTGVHLEAEIWDVIERRWRRDALMRWAGFISTAISNRCWPRSR